MEMKRKLRLFRERLEIMGAPLPFREALAVDGYWHSRFVSTSLYQCRNDVTPDVTRDVTCFCAPQLGGKFRSTKTGILYNNDVTSDVTHDVTWKRIHVTLFLRSTGLGASSAPPKLEFSTTMRWMTFLYQEVPTHTELLHQKSILLNRASDQCPPFVRSSLRTRMGTCSSSGERQEGPWSLPAWRRWAPLPMYPLEGKLFFSKGSVSWKRRGVISAKSYSLPIG